MNLTQQVNNDEITVKSHLTNTDFPMAVLALFSFISVILRILVELGKPRAPTLRIAQMTLRHQESPAAVVQSISVHLLISCPLDPDLAISNWLIIGERNEWTN